MSVAQCFVVLKGRFCSSVNAPWGRRGSPSVVFYYFHFLFVLGMVLWGCGHRSERVNHSPLEMMMMTLTSTIKNYKNILLHSIIWMPRKRHWHVFLYGSDDVPTARQRWQTYNISNISWKTPIISLDEFLVEVIIVKNRFCTFHCCSCWNISKGLMV